MNNAVTRPVALVTGAGSGVGRAVALALLNANYRVVLAGRRQETLAETAAMAAAGVDDALPHVADTRSAASVAALFAACRETFGRLDLLFNNAGVAAPPGGPEDLAPEAWRDVIETNVTGYFLCTREAIRMMSEQLPKGGRIINNGSVAAIAPRPNSIAYATSKHAITGMTKATLLDGRKHNIACGQIDIGNAMSDMSAAFAVSTEQADGTMAAEPVMEVRTAAETVLYMASLPLEVNIPFMVVMPTMMPLFGRG